MRWNTACICCSVFFFTLFTQRIKNEWKRTFSGSKKYNNNEWNVSTWRKRELRQFHLIIYIAANEMYVNMKVQLDSNLFLYNCVRFVRKKKKKKNSNNNVMYKQYIEICSASNDDSIEVRVCVRKGKVKWPEWAYKLVCLSCIVLQRLVTNMFHSLEHHHLSDVELK